MLPVYRNSPVVALETCDWSFSRLRVTFQRLWYM